MKVIYRFKLYCGRMGNIESVFVATREQVESSLGKTAYFGEVLGKHSDISCRLEKGHYTVLSEDQNAIEVVEFLGILPTGRCPLDYLPEEEE